MKMILPKNETLLQATIVLTLLVILLALEEILAILRSRPFVVMEYVPGPEPVTIEGTATVTERDSKGRFVKKEKEEISE